MSVARLLELYRLHQEGRFWKLGSPWIEVPLLPEEYEELRAQLKNDRGLWCYVKEEIQQEYDREARKITIRYPGHHSYVAFTCRIINDIIRQLIEIQDGHDDVADIARDIWPRVQSYVLLHGTVHYPDASFLFESDDFPRMVIEVSSPLKRKYLPYLAHDYIAGSRGNIELVIGLNIDHWGSKKASISVWRPGSTKGDDGRDVLTCVQTLKNHCFRSEDGSAVEGNLAFQLRDFVPPKAAYRITGMDIPIVIPYSKLTQYLDYAESRYAKDQQTLEEGGLVTRKRYRGTYTFR
ncbi:hypothetical protein GP486_005412 [Trichoglossum hirsutum]|uniref:Uncharacterized protein n=1 Tax=Trichoglossum hirsutum TaxID=265104 RepID=A0A9P8L9G8_9PEZI|nr:hypothetical protein GP486_005412 [Trichoglossum hirsutum]